MIKLISLDLDGTLLDPKGRITQASRAAIARARAAGVRVIVNTGRPIQEGVWFARETGCDALAAGAGGGVVAEGENILRRWDVPQVSARRAIQLCLNWDARLMLFTNREILVSAAYKKYLEVHYPFPAFHRATLVTEDFLGCMEERSLSLVKIHGEKGPGYCPAQELAALPDVTVTTSSPHDFELTAGGADKGQALAVIAAMYGISPDRCAAVGDSENDLSAFHAVGLPVAMGNAPEHVKAAAACVAPSNTEEGAAWAVLHCLER